MNNTIKELFDLQMFYLIKVLDNIPENKLYEKQGDGFNSAGWTLGHLIVESEDLFSFLNIPTIKIPDEWDRCFKNGKRNGLEDKNNLPSKGELINAFQLRYNSLMTNYLKLTNVEKESPHPSEMLRDFYSNLDSWYVHHLITHVAVHIGNITTWKKVIGLEVNGI